MKKDIAIFYLFSFLVGFYLANGTTVLFERVLGFSFSRVFTLGAIYMLMFIIFEIPSGAFADLIGRKKLVILGCFILTIAAIATGLSRTFTEVLLSFFIWALGFSCISGADEALLYDRLSDKESYVKIMGKSRFFALSGTALAAVLGPYLFTLNFRLPYLTSSLPFFLAGMAMMFFKEDSHAQEFTWKRHIDQIKTGMRLAYHNKFVLWSMAIMSLTFAVWYNLSNSYQPYLIEINFSVRHFSFILPALFILEAWGGWISGKFYELFGENKLFTFAVLGIGLALGLAGVFTIRSSLFLLLAYSFLLGVIRPVISIYSNRHIESSHRATVISVQAMIATVTAASTLFLFGFLTDKIGIANLFIVLGGLIIVAGTLLLVSKPKNAA